MTIVKVRQEWSSITRIDPSSTVYKKLIAFLNSLTQEQLKLLAESNINFVSRLARNRYKGD